MITASLNDLPSELGLPGLVGSYLETHPNALKERDALRLTNHASFDQLKHKHEEDVRRKEFRKSIFPELKKKASSFQERIKLGKAALYLGDDADIEGWKRPIDTLAELQRISHFGQHEQLLAERTNRYLFRQLEIRP